MKYINEYLEDIRQAAKLIPNLDQIANNTIVITGVTGMIGSTIADILLLLNRENKLNIELLFLGRSKDKVRNRFSNYHENNDYKFVYFDAIKECNINCNADFIIHCASNANPAAYQKEPVNTMLGNIIGANSLLSLASSLKKCRFLYISSSEVYGINNCNLPYSEVDYNYIDILNPRNCYPMAKRTVETLCASYSYEKGVDFVVARPGHIYGPSISDSDTRASAQFTRKGLEKKDIIMKSEGRQKRSYCYTLDCATAIITILLNGEKGEAYNISNKNSIKTIRELAECIAKESGVNIVYEKPSKTEIKSYNLMPNSSLDASKLEELGWVPMFSLEDGIRKTLKYLI